MHNPRMIQVKADTLDGCVRLARFKNGDEGRDATAAGASLFLSTPISRDYIRRIEEPDSRAGLAEDAVNPLVVRALAAWFNVAIEDLSPMAAEKLERMGIKPVSAAQRKRAITLRLALGITEQQELFAAA